MPSSAAALLDDLFEQPARFLARGTEEGMEPDDLLCSRNARLPKALVERAQSRINQATHITYRKTEGARFENPEASETTGLDLTALFRSQSLTEELEAGEEPVKPDRAR